MVISPCFSVTLSMAALSSRGDTLRGPKSLNSEKAGLGDLSTRVLAAQAPTSMALT